MNFIQIKKVYFIGESIYMYMSHSKSAYLPSLNPNKFRNGFIFWYNTKVSGQAKRFLPCPAKIITCYRQLSNVFFIAKHVLNMNISIFYTQLNISTFYQKIYHIHRYYKQFRKYKILFTVNTWGTLAKIRKKNFVWFYLIMLNL